MPYKNGNSWYVEFVFKGSKHRVKIEASSRHEAEAKENEIRLLLERQKAKFRGRLGGC